mgnify:CR=1 FL=1
MSDIYVAMVVIVLAKSMGILRKSSTLWRFKLTENEDDTHEA